MFKVKKGFTVIEIAIVVAIVAILAGVWYVSKSKAGASVAMPGIGNTGGTKPGGKSTPPKMMGTIWGYVKDTKGNVMTNAIVVGYDEKIGFLDNTKTDSAGKYTAIVSKGDFVGFAVAFEKNSMGKIGSFLSDVQYVSVVPGSTYNINFTIDTTKK